MSESNAPDRENVTTEEETTEEVPADGLPDPDSLQNAGPEKQTNIEDCESVDSLTVHTNVEKDATDAAIVETHVESFLKNFSALFAEDEASAKQDTESEQTRNPRGRKKTKSLIVDKGRRQSSASVGSDLSADSKSLPRRHGILFEVGSRLKARDFSKKWYDAKIVAIDEDRMEIKIHFDRWNSRYDQWIPMISKDLRAVSPDRLSKKTSLSFKAGDEVLAKWRDQNMYPAKVEKVYDNGSYLVIFYDGFVNKMTTAHMEPLPSKCVGKLKFPSLEEAKKNRKSCFGAISSPLPCLDGVPMNAIKDIIAVPKDDHIPTKEFIIEEDHNHFKCTVSDCNKSFRKEKLLESHYKHYHNMKYTPKASSSKIKQEPPDSDSNSDEFVEREMPHKKANQADAYNRKEQDDSEKPKETGVREKARTALRERKRFIRKKRYIKQSLERNDSPVFKEKKDQSLEKPVVSKTEERSGKTALLPQRTSTRRVTLPAKFASEEICLMQPLGRDRTLSNREEKIPKEKAKHWKRRERFHAKESLDTSKSKTDGHDAKLSGYASMVEKMISKQKAIKEEKSDSMSDNIQFLNSKKKSDAEIDASLVKGPAVAKKILQENNPDPDRLERMITIASSKKHENQAVKKDVAKRDASTSKFNLDIHSKKTGVHDTPVKGKFEKNKSRIKRKPLHLLEKKVEKKDNIEALPLPTDAVSSTFPVPERDQTPSISGEKSDFPASLKQTSEDAELGNENKEQDVKPTDSLSAIAESLNEILNTGMSKSKTDLKLDASTLPEVKGSPSKATQLSPSSSHVMCTRRKEAILEKEKAAQSVGGHVMCTRKKSEKLARVEEKFKQKNASPAKGEVTPPQTTPALKKRRFFSPSRYSDVQRKAVPPKAEQDTLIKELLSKEPKDALVPYPSIKAEPQEEPEAQPCEEKVSKGADEVVHCLCGCWEEEGLMMQCEICLTWQHGSCFNIEEEKDVPEKYVCFACLEPKGLREGFRYKFDQSWFKKGEMPFYPFASETDRSSANTEDVQETHNLVASIHGVFQTLRSLNHKIHIVSAEAHPDLPLFYKPYSGSSDETEIDEKDQDGLEGKGLDATGNTSGGENLELEKHQLTSQNLVTFDHSYYSPEVDILDLDAMPLIIDDDFKSETSKDAIMDTSEPPDDMSDVNIKSSSPDLLADDHAMTMFQDEKETSSFDPMLMDVNTSSSTESAKETKDQEALLDLVESIKETCNAASAAAYKNELDTGIKGVSTLGQSSGTGIMSLLLKNEMKDNKVNEGLSLELHDSEEQPEMKGICETLDAIGEDYTSETSFCKPVSSTSNFFGGLLKDGELELPLVSMKKGDLLNDFNYNAKCKRNLMDHINTTLSYLEPELDRIQELVEVLEQNELQRQTQADNPNKSKKGIKVPNYRKLRRLKKDLVTVLSMSKYDVT